MKNFKTLFAIAGIVLLASCAKASEKATGNYTGNYTIGSNYSGTTAVTQSGDNVNMDLVCSSLAINSSALGVTVALSGDNVTFTFSSSTTTAGEVKAISGTLTDKTLTFTWTISLGGASTVAGSFSGTKP